MVLGNKKKFDLKKKMIGLKVENIIMNRMNLVQPKDLSNV